MEMGRRREKKIHKRRMNNYACFSGAEVEGVGLERKSFSFSLFERKNPLLLTFPRNDSFDKQAFSLVSLKIAIYNL